MKLIKPIILMCSLLSLTGCFEQKTNPVGAIAKDGSKYTVLHQDLTKHDGKDMFLMCYLSTNVNDKEAYQKELDDLYGIAATNIDPDSDFELIGIKAISPKSETNVVSKLSGTLDFRSFKDVMKLRPEYHDSGPGKQLLWKKK